MIEKITSMLGNNKVNLITRKIIEHIEERIDVSISFYIGQVLAMLAS